MPTHSEVRHSPYSPKQIYDLVVDIERYPEFLPWCRASRVTERKADHFIGELIISFSHLTERYSSKVVPIAPTFSSPLAGEAGWGGVTSGATTLPAPSTQPSPAGGEGVWSEGSIEVELVNGPFKHLFNHWRFEPKDDGTDIHFAVDFEFKSKWFNSLIGGLFTRAVEKMGAAFLARADALYGA